MLESFVKAQFNWDEKDKEDLKNQLKEFSDFVNLDFHRYVAPSGNEYDLYELMDAVWSYSDDEVTPEQKAMFNKLFEAIGEEGSIDYLKLNDVLSDDEFM